LSVNAWINSSIPSPAAFCKADSTTSIIILFIYNDLAKLRILFYIQQQSLHNLANLNFIIRSSRSSHGPYHLIFRRFR
ncbi:hypothetical protein, partial [Bacteroides caecimuris]|uniref:hypothetical protein n=1 Tax=Bacteroides caecimuris TaxID=1796613 RepID=UPI0026E42B9B